MISPPLFIVLLKAWASSQPLLKLKFKDKFGIVKEITAQAWTQEVNQAGEGIWVVVHLYDKGVMLSNILNKHFVEIANKHKYVKFVRGVASVSHFFPYLELKLFNFKQIYIHGVCPVGRR